MGWPRGRPPGAQTSRGRTRRPAACEPLGHGHIKNLPKIKTRVYANLHLIMIAPKRTFNQKYLTDFCTKYSLPTHAERKYCYLYIFVTLIQKIHLSYSVRTTRVAKHCVGNPRNVFVLICCCHLPYVKKSVD